MRMVASVDRSLKCWHVWPQRSAPDWWAGVYGRNGQSQLIVLPLYATRVPTGLVSQLIEPICGPMMGANTLVGWLKKKKKKTAWRAKHIAVIGRRKCEWS